MKILKKDLKQGLVFLQVENLDDLWFLSQIVDAGDLVKGKTTRKIKLGESDSRSSDSVKKTLTLLIKIDKVEYKEDSLRLAGTIAEETEDVAIGSHHTLSVEEGARISIKKADWLSYQLKRLKESTVERSNILLLVVDRENAIFALLKQQGYEVLSEIEGEVQKKGDDKSKGKNFYKEIIKMLSDYTERKKISHVIIASPAFWKEEVIKEINDDKLKKKIVSATCSSVTRNAIEEVLKRPELKQVLHADRNAVETNLVEQLMGEISKDGKASYGEKEVKKAADAGAIDKLLVTTKLIAKKRDEQNFFELEKIMKNTDNAKGEVVIINSENEAGKLLDGLGGVGAVLRYKISY